MSIFSELPADLAQVIKELHNISGFRISIYDTNLHEIAAYPPSLCEFCSLVQRDAKVRARCIENDTDAFQKVRESEKLTIYQCHFGLYEAVAPLYQFGVLSGYLMMGQALNDHAGGREAVLRNATPYVKDRLQLAEAVEKIPSTSKDKIVSCSFFMNLCAEYITLSNRLNTADKNLASGVKKYLNQNFGDKITVELLCNRFFCSKSTLNQAFKAKYRKTVIQYLNELRIQKAQELLKNSRKSVFLVAHECGFTDQNYFSKAFSRAAGITPTQYRNRYARADD